MAQYRDGGVGICLPTLAMDGAVHQPRTAKSLTLAAMSFGFGVVQLDVTIVNTALGSIGSALRAGVSELQWVVSAYTVAFAALILTAGALGDRVGAKRTFMIGFVIFTAASVACAAAPTATLLIAARAIQGAGAAILVPNSLALLNHAYRDANERNRAVGIWAAGASLALMAGPLAGGGLIALIGWRSIFVVNLPIGLTGLWLTWQYADETTRSPQRALDLPAQAAAMGALGCLAGAIIEGGTVGWANAWVISCFAASVVLAACFVVREQRTDQPMLPLALFRHRLFALASLVGLLANVAFYGTIFVLSLFFQQESGRSALATGLAFLPMMAAVFPTNLLASRVAGRWGALRTIAAGAAIAAAGCASLIGIQPGAGYGELCAPLVAIGAGLGLLVPPLTAMLLGSVETSRSGVAAGVLNSTRQTGSVLGVAVFGTLVQQPHTFVTGTHRSLIISACLFAIGMGIVLLFGRPATRDYPAAKLGDKTRRIDRRLRACAGPAPGSA